VSRQKRKAAYAEVSGNTLQQVWKFKLLGVVFTN